MFYTTPSFAFTPGIDFTELGAEPGTLVWRAVKLTIPKFFFVVEYKSGDRKEFTQTVFCAEIQPVLEHLSDGDIDEARAYLWVPTSESAKQQLELLPLKCVHRGNYKSGLFRPNQVVHIFETECGQRFVEVRDVPENLIKDLVTIYQMPAPQ